MSTPVEMPRDTTGARLDQHDYGGLTEDSWFVHRGNRADDTTGAIRTPIVMANSYLLPGAPTTLDALLRRRRHPLMSRHRKRSDRPRPRHAQHKPQVQAHGVADLQGGNNDDRG